jgi:hypothetical protein
MQAEQHKFQLQSQHKKQKYNKNSKYKMCKLADLAISADRDIMQ